MAEVRFTVDQDYMEELQDALREHKSTEVMRSALALLKWAAEEVKSGRVILSASPDGGNLKQLAMPALQNIKTSSNHQSRR